MTIRYVDLVNGVDANSGATFALRKKTISSATSGLAGGDEVRVMESPPLTTIGTCDWTQNSATLTIPNTVTAIIDNCVTAWTASANVTCATNTTIYTVGTASSNFTVAAGFTTGKIAYKTLPSALDLSGYQQISFFLYANTLGSLGTANTLTLNLCSDTTGDVVVNSFQIPKLGTGRYFLTLDKAVNLGASIASISFSSAVDPGACVFLINHLIACKDKTAADCITLGSLIGKNISTDKFWYQIQNITGTTVMLRQFTPVTTSSAVVANLPKYGGPTESVTTYVRRCTSYLDIYPGDLTIATSLNASSAGGTIGVGLLNITAGWNTTDMSTRTSETFIDNFYIAGAPASLFAPGQKNIFWDNWGAVNYTSLLYTTSSQTGWMYRFGTIWKIGCTSNNTAAQALLVSDTTWSTGGTVISNVIGGGFYEGNNEYVSYLYGLDLTAATTNTGPLQGVFNINNLTINNYSGVIPLGNTNTLSTINTLTYNTTLPTTTNLSILRSTASSCNTFIETLNINNTISNTTAFLLFTATDFSAIKINSLNFANTTKTAIQFCGITSTGATASLNYTLSVNNFNGTAVNIFDNTNFIVEKTSVLTHSSGTALRIYQNINAPTKRLDSVSIGGPVNPICTYDIGQVFCKSGISTTVSCWVYVGNAGNKITLYLKGQGYSITPTNYSTSATSGAWEQLSFTFTPAYDMSLQIAVSYYIDSTSQYIYIDDLSVTQ